MTISDLWQTVLNRFEQLTVPTETDAFTWDVSVWDGPDTLDAAKATWFYEIIDKLEALS